MATLTEGTRSNNSAMKRRTTVDCRYLSGRSGSYKSVHGGIGIHVATGGKRVRRFT